MGTKGVERNPERLAQRSEYVARLSAIKMRFFHGVYIIRRLAL